ncbi:hypothetical protein MATL_G00130860 [Megalops atlanticus]|uniref:THD domain-containing protein n=1 Tax=Megalops atlanticus TaxID=7932 RepID=A0A9D3T3Y7_MEGAT|nr:hypothetical protein MATL_G00130860 [Megalops atlanticus]
MSIYATVKRLIDTTRHTRSADASAGSVVSFNGAAKDVEPTSQLSEWPNTQDLTTASGNTAYSEPVIAPSNLPPGRHLSHIQLTMDSNLTLKYDLPARFVAASRSLVICNNSVCVNSGGLYYFYAHVTFSKVNPEKRMVTLIRNRIPHQLKELKLSEAVSWGDQESSVSMSKRIRCQRGDSLRLEIKPNNTLRLHNTHWGLFLLTPY